MSRYLTIIICLIATLSAGPIHAQNELIEQWVQGAVGQSSGINSTAGESERIFGEPDATCVPFEDLAFEFNAWVTGEPDRGEEWIEVRFAQPVFATAIEVHEALNPGAVVRILIRDFSGELHEVWAGKDPNDTCPAVLRADFEPLAFASNTVRVELNTALVPGFNQLDAVKLVGRPVTDFEPFFVRIDDEAGGNPSRIYRTTITADLNNDGDLDFMQTATLTNSGALQDEISPQRTTLFLNLGDEQFLDVTEGSGLQALNATTTGFGNFSTSTTTPMWTCFSVLACCPFSKIRETAYLSSAPSNRDLRVWEPSTISTAMALSM